MKMTGSFSVSSPSCLFANKSPVAAVLLSLQCEKSSSKMSDCEILIRRRSFGSNALSHVSRVTLGKIKKKELIVVIWCWLRNAIRISLHIEYEKGIYFSVYLSIVSHLSKLTCSCLSTHTPKFFISIYLSIYHSIYLSIYLSLFLSIYLSI